MNLNPAACSANCVTLLLCISCYAYSLNRPLLYITWITHTCILFSDSSNTYIHGYYNLSEIIINLYYYVNYKWAGKRNILLFKVCVEAGLL